MHHEHTPTDPMRLTEEYRTWYDAYSRWQDADRLLKNAYRLDTLYNLPDLHALIPEMEKDLEKLKGKSDSAWDAYQEMRKAAV